jgi:hypothetical protein
MNLSAGSLIRTPRMQFFTALRQTYRQPTRTAPFDTDAKTEPSAYLSWLAASMLSTEPDLTSESFNPTGMEFTFQLPVRKNGTKVAAHPGKTTDPPDMTRTVAASCASSESREAIAHRNVRTRII